MSRYAKNPKTDPTLAKLRKLALALPGTTETLTWGHPNFRVANKIFAGYGEADGCNTLGVKVGKPRQKELLKDSRFTFAEYVGRFGWVTLALKGRIDWQEVAGLLLTSYLLIAPKELRTVIEGH